MTVIAQRIETIELRPLPYSKENESKLQNRESRKSGGILQPELRRQSWKSREVAGQSTRENRTGEVLEVAGFSSRSRVRDDLLSL